MIVCQLMQKTPAPIFVFSVPRSGNTLIGNWIDSHPQVLYLNEYAGVFLMHGVVPFWMDQVPGAFKERYIHELKNHSVTFPESLAKEANAEFWCDSAPWNIYVLKDLKTLFPNAIYVLMVRSHRGAILSRINYHLENNATAPIVEHAKIWAQLNEIAFEELPDERSLVVSYDQICQFPKSAIKDIGNKLSCLGLDPDLMDIKIFGTQWAPAPGKVSSPETDEDHTVGVFGDNFSLKPRRRFNPNEWNSDYEDTTASIVSPIVAKLTYRWPWLKPYLS